MATNHTTNYHLNTWEPGDSFLRTEFNENFDKLDTALKAKASAAALNALTQVVNGKGNCQVACGSYVGTGTHGSRNHTTLTLGFQPKLLLIGYGSDLGIFISGSNAGRNVGSGRSLYVTWLDDGLEWYADDNASSMVQLNYENATYHYVAFY